MNILDSDRCLYCKNAVDSLTRALIDCPHTAQLWREIEIWFRSNIHHTVRLSDREKIFGFQENMEIAFIINMLIISTTTILYMKKPEGKNLRI